jgi:hypothetical protein
VPMLHNAMEAMRKWGHGEPPTLAAHQIQDYFRQDEHARGARWPQ